MTMVRMRQAAVFGAMHGVLRPKRPCRATRSCDWIFGLRSVIGGSGRGTSKSQAVGPMFRPLAFCTIHPLSCLIHPCHSSSPTMDPILLLSIDGVDVPIPRNTFKKRSQWFKALLESNEDPLSFSSHVQQAWSSVRALVGPSSILSFASFCDALKTGRADVSLCHHSDTIPPREIVMSYFGVTTVSFGYVLLRVGLCSGSTRLSEELYAIPRDWISTGQIQWLESFHDVMTRSDWEDVKRSICLSKERNSVALVDLVSPMTPENKHRLVHTITIARPLDDDVMASGTAWPATILTWREDCWHGGRPFFSDRKGKWIRDTGPDPEPDVERRIRFVEVQLPNVFVVDQEMYEHLCAGQWTTEVMNKRLDGCVFVWLSWCPVAADEKLYE